MFSVVQIRRYAVCLFAGCATTLAAESPLAVLFRDPPADHSRPCLAVPFDKLSGEKELLFRQLSLIRDFGAGGVLVRVPIADDAVWTRLTWVSDTCRRLGLELGICDFPLSAEEVATRPRLQRLVWSARCAVPTEMATNACPSVFQPDRSYRELARLAVPTEGEVQSHQVVELKDGTVPTNGVWRIYRFGCSDMEPALADWFEENGVFRHVNQLLFTSQSRLARTYGTTFQWCQMSGSGTCDWM